MLNTSSLGFRISMPEHILFPLSPAERQWSRIPPERGMSRSDRGLRGLATKKVPKRMLQDFFSSGGWTRTNDLRVMSPTSYQLLYPAMLGLQR